MKQHASSSIHLADAEHSFATEQLNMKMHRYVLTALLISAFPGLALTQEYRTKSVFSKSYRCVADESGGFTHSASGHKLTLFKTDEEFFLTHISNLPDKLVLQLSGRKGGTLSGIDGVRAREEVERRLMKQETMSGVDFVSETGSYFIREPSVEPESLMATMYACKAIKAEDATIITCYGDGLGLGKTFQFMPGTGRFTFSYSGTWHNKVKDNYYGDSSSFAFGTCKEYYR